MNTIQRNFVIGLLQSLTLIAVCLTSLHFSGFPPKTAMRLGIVVTVILLFGVLRLLMLFYVESRLRRGIEEKNWAPELKVSPKRFVDYRLVMFSLVFVVVFLLTRFI
jgi:hypothetical protein